MVVSDTWNMIDVIHYFSDVGIWASLGKDENIIQGLTQKCIVLLYKIVIRAEHEIGTKS